MAYKVKILPAAEREVDEILEYLLRYGKNTARHFADTYRRQLELLGGGVVDYGLSHLPELSALGYHSCLVNSYVLLYYYEGESLVIAHVFHQSQDYAPLVTLRHGDESN